MNPTYQYKSKLPMWISGVVMLMLLGLSAYFWLERSTYMDMAFHTYAILQSKWFAIQNQRFGAGFTQLFPLFTGIMQWPLKEVLVAYSISFYIYYLLIFLVVTRVYSNHYLGLVLVFLLTLITSNCFYWAQSEFPQGLAFLVLLLAATLYYRNQNSIKWWQWLLLVSMLVTTIFFHPLNLIPFGFCMTYFWLNRDLPKQWFLGLVAFALTIVVSKIIFIKTGKYETGKFGGIKNFITLFPNYFTIPSTSFFVKELMGNYVAFLAVFVLVAAHYLRHRFWFKLALYCTGVVGYIFLVNVSYPQVVNDPYTQNLLLPIALMSALPFCFEILPLANTRLVFFVLIVLFCFRLSIIYSAHTDFTERVNYLTKVIDYTKQYPSKKFWIEEQKLKKIVGLYWALPYETLILSSIDSPDSARTVELASIVEGNEWMLTADTTFINSCWGWDIKGMPKAYFRLDTSDYIYIQNDLSSF